MEKIHPTDFNAAIDPSIEERLQNEPEKSLQICGPEEEAVASRTVEEKFEYVTGIKLYLALFVVCLAAFTMLLDTSIIVTAIPRITSDFHSLQDVGWYGSAYLLANCSFQPLTGKFYAQFSSKYTFLVFLGVFELGSVICGVSNSSKMLIVGRAVAGLGSSGIQNGGLTILTACVPLEKRPVYLGFLMSVAQMGILFGPLIGGALTQYTTWRWCFYINLPIGAIAALILVFIHIPDLTPKSKTRIPLKATIRTLDLFGFILFAPSSIMFLLALQWGGDTYPWNSGTVIGLFCGSAINLGLFLAWDYRRGDTAMIPFSILRNRVICCACLSQFFFSATLLIPSYYLAIYFQAVRGVKPMLSGVYVLPGILSSFFTAPTAGLLVVRVGYYIPFAAFGAILNSIGCGLISLYNPTTTTAAWIGYQILAGIGRGVGIQMPIVAVQNNVEPSQGAVSLTFLVFSQTFGGALFLSFAQTVFSNGLAKSLAKYAPGVNPKVVAAAGATGFREVVPTALVDGVIQSYSVAVSHCFYLAAGAAVACFVLAWGLGWKNIKKTKKAKSEV